MLINKDNLCLFITTVVRDRLPVFRSGPLKNLACRALDEARSGGFALFAYVIMPEHLHVLKDATRQGSETLRYVNGILSHRLIEILEKPTHHRAKGGEGAAFPNKKVGCWFAERQAFPQVRAAEPQVAMEQP